MGKNITPLGFELTPYDTPKHPPKIYVPTNIYQNLINRKIIKRSLYFCVKFHINRDIIYLLSAYQIVEKIGDKMMSYKKLWKLLIDRDMSKKDLAELADLSQYTINKLNNSGTVTTETLAKICIALNCDVGDICEVVAA